MIGQPHTIPNLPAVVHAALCLLIAASYCLVSLYQTPGYMIYSLGPEYLFLMFCWLHSCVIPLRTDFFHSCSYLLMEYLQQSKGFDEAVLRRQYGYFRDKPAKTFVETRVKLMTLRPDAVSPPQSDKQGSWDALNAPDDNTTDRYLTEHLEAALRSRSLHPCLQIW